MAEKVNKGGAPEGNKNAAGGVQWRNAIKTALAKRSKSKSDAQKALVELAEKMLVAADNGESWAIKELGDRIDGKAPQSIDLKVKELPHEQALDLLDDDD